MPPSCCSGVENGIKSLLTFSRGSKTDQRRLNTSRGMYSKRVYAGSGYGCFPEKLYFLIHQELKSRTVFQAIRCNFLPVSGTTIKSSKRP